MSNKDMQPDSDLSERDVAQRMAAFRAALARMDGDPREAARIQALADKSDEEFYAYLDEFEDDWPIGEDLEAGNDTLGDETVAGDLDMRRERAGAMPEAAASALDVVGAHEPRISVQNQDEVRIYQLVLEAQYKLAMAEQKLAVASERAELIIQQAELEAEARRKEADLEAREEALRRDAEEVSAPRPSPPRPSSRWPTALIPAFFTAMAGMIASLVLVAGHVSSALFLTLAIPVAFSLVIYTMCIAWAVVRVSHPTRATPGAERALYLLLGAWTGDAIRRRRSPLNRS